ncbi:hypothetical protein [Winogradskyella sp. 3972H.M.0a.05]|uniref:hypothetical protein n=1 Tax=Winogradskyella sp. 3972H.M.0a.05 TaxID=2950277 RepID=UPI0033983BC0
MKKLILLIAIICVGFMSCQDRKTQSQALRESIEKFKAETTIEKVAYFPEAYSERVTDSILSNGIKVKVKEYTDMKDAVLNTFKEDIISYKYYYRNVLSEVTIRDKNNTLIFDKTINKNFVLNADESLEGFLANSVCMGLWLDQSKSDDKNTYLLTSYCLPESDECLDYNIIIDSNTGKYRLIPLEEHART